MTYARCLSLLPVLVLTLLGSVGNAADVPDLSTPESAVTAFVEAHNRGDFVQAYRYLDLPPNEAVQRQLVQLAKESEGGPQLRILGIKAITEGDGATLTVNSEFKFGAESVRAEDTVKLRRMEGKWKLIPPTREELARISERRPDPPVLLPVLLGFCAHPEVFLEGRIAARTVACRSNLKQLATSVFFHLQDNNELFKLRADAFKAGLLPYFKGKLEVFRCPMDAPNAVSYSFNHHLQGLSLANVKHSGQTIMLYEGKKGVLDFRHGGRAHVATVDGQPKLVNAQEAAKLRWKP